MSDTMISVERVIKLIIFSSPQVLNTSDRYTLFDWSEYLNDIVTGSTD